MSTSTTHRTIIVGASDKPDRYSHMAQLLLREHGQEVVPVHPKLTSIANVPVVADLSQISSTVDTVTMYVGAAISSGLADKLITLNPRRVIFNPGAENPDLAAKLEASGVMVEEACTLVLLRTGQY